MTRQNWEEIDQLNELMTIDHLMRMEYVYIRIWNESKRSVAFRTVMCLPTDAALWSFQHTKIDLSAQTHGVTQIFEIAIRCDAILFTHKRFH